MKRSVQLKVVVVLGYVALCTMLVLGGEQADAPGQQAPAEPALSVG